MCYQALLDVYSEIEEEMAKEGRSYRVYYAKEAVRLTCDFYSLRSNKLSTNTDEMKAKSILQMKNQVRAYYEEAKWLQGQQIPAMEEYMPVALVTSAYSMLATTSLIGIWEML